jgi:FixJ family two-component response regulator
MAQARTPQFVAIVDDDADMRQATKSLLNSAGIRSAGYSSAESFLRSRRALTCACLVLDLNLPGLDGFGLCDALRNRGATIPIILVTADDDRDLHTKALAKGMLGVLKKPFDGDTLLRLVQRALGR